MEARKAELLAAPYFHVVFTLPPRIGAIAYNGLRMAKCRAWSAAEGGASGVP
jgi:hypothetical protein